MKFLHRPDLFCWSEFNPDRNLDFHSYLWVRGPGANVAVDPLRLTDHDAEHVQREGGIAWIYLTNADHVRDAAEVARRFGARIAAPAAEKDLADYADLPVERWLDPGETLDNGIRCLAMAGSKTPGELAFLLPGNDTAICGDLVRGQRAGRLNLLPDAKLTDKKAAIEAVRHLAERPGLETVLVGDGWPVFGTARSALARLLAEVD